MYIHSRKHFSNGLFLLVKYCILSEPEVNAHAPRVTAHLVFLEKQLMLLSDTFA